MAVDLIDLDKHIARVPHYPHEGILFRESDPLLKHRLKEATAALLEMFTENELSMIDFFAGIASRGYLFAAPMALMSGKGTLKIVKSSAKMAGDTVLGDEYGLEYGSDQLKMLKGKGRIVIVDDLLATGGTLGAAADLAVKAGYEVVGMATLIDLKDVSGGAFVAQGIQCRSVLKYDGEELLKQTDSRYELSL